MKTITGFKQMISGEEVSPDLRKRITAEFTRLVEIIQTYSATIKQWEAYNKQKDFEHVEEMKKDKDKLQKYEKALKTIANTAFYTDNNGVTWTAINVSIIAKEALGFVKWE
jgi:vacuolar-type H+-ATPase subunit I/STV1